jgi:hypothetical protein
MPVFPATAAATARTLPTLAGWGGCGTAASDGGSKDGEFLGKLGRAAVRALAALPTARANQDFAVLLATVAVKFVNRHEATIPVHPTELKRRFGRTRSSACWGPACGTSFWGVTL